MINEQSQSVLGVLGGMGGLASAEFLKTLYEYNASEREQDGPFVIVYSDPTFPDRTEAFLRGETYLVQKQLIEALTNLRRLNVTEIIICCMTIHYLLPTLPEDLRDHVISLLDTIFASLDKNTGPHLMLCSTGTRKLGLFESHARWQAVKDQILFPNEDEQADLHRLIYEMKEGRSIQQMKFYVESLMAKYRLRSFIAGCSEIHLLAKQYALDRSQDDEFSCIDPLLIIAKELREKTHETNSRSGNVPASR